MTKGTDDDTVVSIAFKVYLHNLCSFVYFSVTFLCSNDFFPVVHCFNCESYGFPWWFLLFSYLHLSCTHGHFSHIAKILVLSLWCKIYCFRFKGQCSLHYRALLSSLGSLSWALDIGPIPNLGIWGEEKVLTLII